MMGGAAVSVHDDLAPGEAGVTDRSARHKASGGIDVVLGVGIKQMGRDDRLDDALQHALAQRFGADARRVLRGNHHRIHAHGLGAVVLNRDLRFAVRPHEIENPFAPHFRQAQAELVRRHDGKRHQFFRLVTGVSEHQPLVARPTRCPRPG